MTSLRDQASTGAKWTTFSTVATTGLQLLQVVVLAQLLQPEDFGLMAMILVVLGFAQAYADMGVSNAIIHRQDTTNDQLSTLYWLNALAGIAVFGIVVLAAPAISALYSEQRLTGLVIWSALIFLIAPVGQQFQVLLQKELRFKSLAVIEAVSAGVGAAAAILLAWRGAGVYALIWGQLILSGMKALLLLLVGLREWCPRLHFKKDDLKGYLGFGLNQMGERSVNFLNSRLDQLLIGAILGAQVLGYYNLAFQLVILPISRINPIFTRVAFPVFAKVQSDRAKLKRGYLFILRTISLINFPVLLGLAAVAPFLVPLFFGQKWLPAVGLVQILAFVGIFRATGNPVGSLLLAKGRADLGFKWNLGLFAAHVPGLIIGIHAGGAVGAAISLVVLQAIFSVFNYILLVRGMLGSCLREYLSSMIPLLLLSLVMATGVFLSNWLFEQPSFPALAAQVGAGILIYSGLCLVFRRAHLKETWEIFRGTAG